MLVSHKTTPGADFVPVEDHWAKVSGRPKVLEVVIEEAFV